METKGETWTYVVIGGPAHLTKMSLTPLLYTKTRNDRGM